MTWKTSMKNLEKSWNFKSKTVETQNATHEFLLILFVFASSWTDQDLIKTIYL
jgi:hypothetical protein